MTHYGRLWLLSALSLGACAPLDGDLEGGLAEEVAEDVESDELRYAGRVRLRNGLNNYCAYRSGASDVRVQPCAGGESEYWDIAQFNDGTYAVCKPNTLRSYSSAFNLGGTNDYVRVTGNRADCMMPSGTNRVQVGPQDLTMNYVFGGRAYAGDTGQAWRQSGAYITWGFSTRRLTVSGTGVGMQNNNNNPPSQSWTLIP